MKYQKEISNSIDNNLMKNYFSQPVHRELLCQLM